MYVKLAGSLSVKRQGSLPMVVCLFVCLFVCLLNWLTCWFICVKLVYIC